MFTESVLDGAASLDADALADGVKVTAMEGKGRGIMATQYFQSGDVLVQESAYAAVATLEEIGDTCSREFTPLRRDTKSRCSGCKSVRYSSRKSQKADWAAGHKIECKQWQKMRSKGGSPPDYVPETPIRLLLRILWRREQELQRVKDGEEIPFWQSFSAVASLVDHSDASSAMTDRNRALNDYIANKAIEMSGMTSVPLSHIEPKDAAQLFGKINANSITIQSAQCGTVGTGMYPFGSMANHSDAPNAVQHFHKGELHLRAVRQINKGEEICITYQALEDPSFDRRRHLVNHFHFDNRPDLPPTSKLPEVKSQQISAVIRACVLEPGVGAILTQRKADRALCSVSSPDSAASSEAQYCWACVTTPNSAEPDWAQGVSKASAEEDRGDQESHCGEADMRKVLKDGWRIARVHSGLKDASSRPSWMKQIAEEKFKVVVYLFGDWPESNTEAGASEKASSRWLEVASAAAFGAVGLLWADQMMVLGAKDVGKQVLEAVVAAGEEVGLGDTHQVMMQSRKELMNLFLHTSNEIPSSPTGELSDEVRVVMEQARHYGMLVIPGLEKIYPPAWYTLGTTYRSLADCEIANNSLKVAVEWKQKAYTCLQTVMGDETPEVQRAKGGLLALTAKSQADLTEATRLLNIV